MAHYDTTTIPIYPLPEEREAYRQTMELIPTGSPITPERLFALGFKQREFLHDNASNYFDLKKESDYYQIFKGRTIVSNDEDAWNFAGMSYDFNFRFYFIEQLAVFLKTNPNIK